MGRSVAWHLVIEPEIATEYAGTRLSDYFGNPNIMVETEVKARREFYRVFGYGSPELESIGVNPYNYTVACILGAQMIIPEDASPQIKGRVIGQLKDIGKLTVPEDIGAAGYVPKIIQNYEYLEGRSEINGITPVFALHNQSPLGTATILRGTEIFADVIEEPGAIKDLLEIITETALRVIRFQEKYTGRQLDRIDMDDDYGGLFSPELYEELNLPYMKRIYHVHEVRQRGIHTETLAEEHLQFLRRVGITDYDAWPYHGLTAKTVRATLPEIDFGWNIETAKDLYADTPAEIQKKYREAVQDGAPRMVLNLCARGVPRENIRAFIDAAGEFE